MTCYKPITVYQKFNDESSFSPNPRDGFLHKRTRFPCRRCIGCRLDYSRAWSIRCQHEIQTTEEKGQKSCFVTLTYNNEHLPRNGSINRKHLQNFMKYLRRDKGAGIRFFACGEYGGLHKRPHYHLILFNCEFKDMRHHDTNKRTGDKYYVSEELNKIWNKGYCIIGEANADSSNYVARYITKKINGKMAWQHYIDCDVNGEITAERKPEFSAMSRMPGIGHDFFLKNGSNMYALGHAIVKKKGRLAKFKIPEYYDKVFEKHAPNEMEKIKSKRKELAKEHEKSYQRLAEKETHKLETLKRLKRPIEV